MFAVDAGDTQGVGQIIQKHSLKGKVIGGGYDLLPGTLDLINKGFLDFTIDQQPYLQGFYPVIQLFLYKLSGGLQAPVRDEHGPAVRDEGERQAVPDDQDPLRRQLDRAEVSCLVVADGRSGGHVLPRRRAGLGWRVAGMLLRRREASIFVVAVGLRSSSSGAEERARSRERQHQERHRVDGARIALIAAGEVMLLICGEIDLAVGRVFALAPALVWSLSSPDQHGLPIWARGDRRSRRVCRRSGS